MVSRPKLGISHSLSNIKKHLAATLQSDSGLLPLPEEKYPRAVADRKPDRGYYVALGLVLSVWMITPLSRWVSAAPRTGVYTAG